jgi:glycosyltransferase involved in cell wall biosynthesis
LPKGRVLHVNDRRPDALGGAEVLMSRTCELLRSDGWDVRTFTEADLPDARSSAVRYVHNRAACTALGRFLTDFRPDVVHVHNIYHLLSPAILAVLSDYKRREQARVVMTAHDYHLVCPNSGGNWFRHGPRLADVDRLQSWRYLLTRRWDHRGLTYSLLKLLQHIWNYRLRDRRRVFDVVICTCRFLQELVSRAGIRAVHVANPNPPVAIKPAQRPAELTCVFAGRVEPEKGLRRFLELLPADFTGRLQVVGDGSDLEACAAVCRERGLTDRVELLGRRTHEETIALIAAAHVVVVPSLLFETYPLVVQEAFTVGTNALVADYGGMREIVMDAGIGYRFHPDHPETLAEPLRLIAEAHAAGTLNSFDPSRFLAGRTETAYLSALTEIYAGGPA